MLGSDWVPSLSSGINCATGFNQRDRTNKQYTIYIRYVSRAGWNPQTQAGTPQEQTGIHVSPCCIWPCGCRRACKSQCPSPGKQTRSPGSGVTQAGQLRPLLAPLLPRPREVSPLVGYERATALLPPSRALKTMSWPLLTATLWEREFWNKEFCQARLTQYRASSYRIKFL